MVQNRWFMLALLFLARTAMGLQFQTVGSVGPFLVDSLGFQYAAIGALIGFYLLPGVFVSLPGGLLGERFGAKQIVVAGLALMFAGGVLMGMSASFAALSCGRLLSGTGAVLINVLLTKMVADWFAGREIATAMAILVTSWPAGIALGLLGFAPLAKWLGWQAVMQLAAFVPLPCLIATAVLYRDPPGLIPAHSQFELKLSAREWTLVSIAGLVWATYNVGYILLVSFLPGHLADRGYGLTEAYALVSWLGWCLIAVVPVGGYLADRLGRSDLVMAAGFIVTAAAAMLLAGASPTLAAFAAAAIAVGLPAGPIMTLPAAAVRAQNRATGMGIYFTWYYALMASIPALAGLARDVTHDSGTPVYCAALMLAAAFISLAAFRFFARRDGHSQFY
jgi:predicted MFS family arabinose efflux permease